MHVFIEASKKFRASRTEKCVDFSIDMFTVVKDIAHAGGGLRFNYRAGRVKHTVANGSLPLRRSFGAVLPRR